MLLDGGSGVNILSESELQLMKNVKLEPAPFQMRMADQSRVQPMGMLRQQVVTVHGLQFQVNFVVLRMKDAGSAYKMLLGRPWFKTAKLKQDWEKNEVILKKGKKTIRLPMGSKKELTKEHKPMMAQTINLAEEIEDDEEDSYLQANPTVVPIFDVDVAGIFDKYGRMLDRKDVSCFKLEVIPGDKGTEDDGREVEEDQDLSHDEEKSVKGKVDDDLNVEPEEAILKAEHLYDKMVSQICIELLHIILHQHLLLLAFLQFCQHFIGCLLQSESVQECISNANIIVEMTWCIVAQPLHCLPFQSCFKLLRILA